MTCENMRVHASCGRSWRTVIRFTVVVGLLPGLLFGCGERSNPGGPQLLPPPPQLRPSITAISPTNAVAGTSDLTLTLTGSNFVSGRPVYTWAIWSGNGGNNTPLKTTFVNSTELTAVVPASLLSRSGTAGVFVETGDPTSVSNGNDTYPQSNSVGFTVSPKPADLRSVGGSYSVTSSVTRADSALGCDPRREGLTETLRIDLRVDGDSRVVEADVVRGSTGLTSHFRGTIDDFYMVTASLVSADQPAGPGAPQCPGGASETLIMRFLGPNYDFCQGFSGQIETQYSFASGKIVEGFFQESC